VRVRVRVKEREKERHGGSMQVKSSEGGDSEGQKSIFKMARSTHNEERKGKRETAWQRS